MSFQNSFRLWARGSAVSALCVAFALSAITTDAEAARKNHRPAAVKKTRPTAKRAVRGYDGGPRAYIVMDARTGEVLAESNANSGRQPASTAKIMTALLVFDALRSGLLKTEQELPLVDGAHLRADGNRTLGQPGGVIRTGSMLTVDTLLRALLVYSACDAAETLAESIGGTEAKFAALMTKKGSDVGMKNTRFTNSSGREDPEQTTTASDMAALYSHMLKTYPEYMHYFSLPSFRVGNRTINGHNSILTDYTCGDIPSLNSTPCTGGKTGFFRRSGFNGVYSATWNGIQIVAVSFGSRSAAARNMQVSTLLDEGFAKLRRNLAPGTVIQAAVPQGIEKQEGNDSAAIVFPTAASLSPRF